MVDQEDGRPRIKRIVKDSLRKFLKASLKSRGHNILDSVEDTESDELKDKKDIKKCLESHNIYNDCKSKDSDIEGYIHEGPLNEDLYREHHKKDFKDDPVDNDSDQGKAFSMEIWKIMEI